MDFTEPTTFPTPMIQGAARDAYDAPEARRDSVRRTRQQAREMRRIEAQGVPFWLPMTNVEATVRRLSFGDKTMLLGLPPHLQMELQAAYNANPASATQKNRTIQDMARLAGSDERIANVLCCAGFVWPRLTLTEDEADRSGDPDVWWVGDLALDERKAYMALVLGNGGAEDLKRIAGFLDARLEDPAAG